MRRRSADREQFLFIDDGALYNGQVVDLRAKISGLVDGLGKDCDQFQKAIVVRRFSDKPLDMAHIVGTERLEHFMRSSSEPPPVRRVGFQDPVAIYYSSGTTGVPKAIVHGVGTILISVAKDGLLHLDIRPDDISLQYTTTSWIMFLSCVSQMALGGQSVLYDGSPFRPDPTLLLRIVEQQRVTMLGVSPRWMSELIRTNIVPREAADLSSLRLVTSTGMVLPEQHFNWFYDTAFVNKVQLINLTGGTDIVLAALE